jgi:ABC-2 type transport system ATP-binding protein
MIDVQDLTKRYDTNTAISGVSFRVEPGEVLDAPLEVRRRIGYLPENPPLYPEMTVASYLRFVAKIKGVPKADIASEVDRVMEKTNTGAVSNRIIARLSKGYKQRVGLAQALLNDPPVLILDEPTIGLDPKQIREVRELIREWSGRHTVILSTHILPEVEQTCSRVIIIDRGRIVAVDNPANLVQQLKGADRTLVEVSGPVDAILESFRGMEGVLEARDLGASGGGASGDRHTIQIETGSLPEDPRPALARLIVQNGWSLFQMQSRTMSLEDVFLKLTTQDDEGAGESQVLVSETESVE